MAQFLQGAIAIFENVTRFEVEAIFYTAAHNWMINRVLIQVTVRVLVWSEGHEPSLQIEVQINMLSQSTAVDAGIPSEL